MGYLVAVGLCDKRVHTDNMQTPYEDLRGVSNCMRENATVTNRNPTMSPGTGLLASQQSTVAVLQVFKPRAQIHVNHLAGATC